MLLMDLIKQLFTWSYNNKQEELKKFSVWNYSVKILSLNTNKYISTIKSLKDLLWIGLKEAKDMLSNFPSSAISWISKFDAEKIKEELEKLWIEAKIIEKQI